MNRGHDFAELFLQLVLDLLGNRVTPYMISLDLGRYVQMHLHKHLAPMGAGTNIMN